MDARAKKITQEEFAALGEAVNWFATLEMRILLSIAAMLEVQGTSDEAIASNFIEAAKDSFGNRVQRFDKTYRDVHGSDLWIETTVAELGYVVELRNHIAHGFLNRSPDVTLLSNFVNRKSVKTGKFLDQMPVSIAHLKEVAVDLARASHVLEKRFQLTTS